MAVDSTVLVAILAVVVAAVIFFVTRRRDSGPKGVKEVVGASSDFAAGSMKEVTVRGSKKVLVGRTSDGALFCTASKCTHVGAALSTGVLNGDKVTCPWHAACFNVKTGDIEDGPCFDNLPTYPIREANGKIIVTTPADADSMVTKRPAKPCKLEETDRRNFVIIGGGPAGLSAAHTLREEGFTGTITMITAEETLPYDRVKLSKQGLPPNQATLLLRPEAFYQQQRIRVFTGTRVESVDTATKTIRTAGSSIQYDKLLCATGGAARSFRAPENFVIPGADLQNIFTIRDLPDAVKIEAAFNAIKPSTDVNLVIVGSSFIGMEAASAFAKRDCGSVTVIGMEREPFERVLGMQVGETMRAMHEAAHVAFRMRAVVKRFVGSGNNVTGVAITVDGGAEEILPANLVLIGAGIIPATEYLRGAAGIRFDRDQSVFADETLKATDDVWVAGDIARFPLAMLNEVVRIEHWDVAIDHGRVAAHNMLGKNQRYTGVPFFWTTQQFALRYAGHCQRIDETIIHGDRREYSFVAYYVMDGTIRGVATMKRDPVAAAAQQLFRLGRMPSVEEVRKNDSFDLVAYLAQVSK